MGISIDGKRVGESFEKKPFVFLNRVSRNSFFDTFWMFPDAINYDILPDIYPGDAIFVR